MQTKLLINGEFVAGTEPGRKGAEPAQRQRRLSMLPEASVEQVDAAVNGAVEAFAGWSRTTPAERAAALLRIADRIEAEGEDFGRLEALNCGKPINAAIGDEIPAIVDTFRFFAGAVRNMHGPVAGEYLQGHTSMIRRDPVGVVASVAPWNYPLMMMAWKLAPALAGGNTVVFKPSEQTPLTALTCARILAEELPRGVINVIAGRGETVGDGAGQSPQGRHDLADRRCRHRKENAAGGLEIGQAHASRTGRQGSGHRLRRRRSGRGGRGAARLRLLQCRAGLHRRVPHLRGAEDPTTGWWPT